MPQLPCARLAIRGQWPPRSRPELRLRPALAMLYVPLFFYIFDRLNERSAAKKEKAATSALPAGGAAASAPHAPREGD